MSDEGARLVALITGASEISQELKYLRSVECWRIAVILRNPDQTKPLGRVITKEIVPSVKALGYRFPIPLGNLFSPALIRLVASRSPMEIKELALLPICNVREIDTVMEALYRPNHVTMPRAPVWDIVCHAPELRFRSNGPPLSEAQKILVFGQSDPPPTAKIIVLKTKYRLKKATIERRSMQERFEASETIRENIKNRHTTPDSFDEFEKVLQKNLHSGIFGKRAKFVIFKSSLIRGNVLKITGDKGDLLAFVCANTPSHLQDGFIDKYMSLYPGTIKECNSAELGLRLPFKSSHFSLYNKFSAIAPEGTEQAHPSTFVHGSQTRDSSTLQPRESEAVLSYPLEFSHFKDSFQPLCEWISSQIQDLIPEEAGILEAYLNTLPGSPTVAVHPMPCMALNHNPCTLQHFDGGDAGSAIVIAFIKGKGGQLVLVELGLVLELESGHIVIFPACKLSHLNLHYEGFRVSMVFHSDCSSQAWLRNRNGLKKNQFFTAPF
ncbi:hypothetical protein FA15DRAFT_432567 [Coprinopsis marcescibilis]|uniref:Uncharacterized protein n=1 Tax=Coprinopsis marcescibilis TaxID=230819 RepID=A0A5C3K9K4_COPMA|nr:hypothetical protein FA15DRAFT_432567 [Coprinopsis marcescibilis]